MRYLITGATGFIGSHLVDLLYTQGYDLRVLVRNESKLADLKKYPIEAVQGDLFNQEALDKATKDIDGVFHLAAEVRAIANNTPALFTKTNVVGTKNVLDACVKNNVKKVVAISSIAAQGVNKPGQSLVTEDMANCNPDSPYGESKKAMEDLCLQIMQQTGMPIALPRPGFVFGEKAHSVSQFFKAVKAGQFRFINQGETRWSFVYVKNLVQGLMQAMHSKQANGEAFFLTDEHPYTIREFTEAIAEAYHVEKPGSVPGALAGVGATVLDVFSGMTGKKFPLTKERLHRLTHDMAYSCEKSKKLINYNPEIQLSESIPATVAWYNENGFPEQH
jgi:nucleoside-diphosphate-sugar epimerase